MGGSEQYGAGVAGDMPGHKGCHVHLLGVCGVGMAGLAFLLKAGGFKVSGCDLARNRLSEWLEARGISVRDGHDPSHVAGDVEWLTRSAAVPAGCEEASRAREMGLAVLSRGEVLPRLLEGRVSVAVAGTHGKTTTTAFITQLLKSAGLDPSWCIGGEVECLGGVAGTGAGPIVVEADESDGTLALYKPDIAVVTNIEFDHMEHFGSVEAFEECFRRFAANTRRKLVYCADDRRAASLCRGAAGSISYGLSEGSDLRAVDVAAGGGNLEFGVVFRGRLQGRLALPVPGRHNVLNALAASAAALELGLSFERIRESFSTIELPRRRFDRVVDGEEITVISDYAHHPTEIAALIDAASDLAARSASCRRLTAVFQPHRYTRTRALGPSFPAAFRGVDELALVPVYAASEPPVSGGSVWDLYAHFRAAGGDAPVPLLARSQEEAWAYFRRGARRGDILLVVGAGDVERIAGWAEAEFGQRGPSAGDDDAAWVRELGREMADTRFRLNEPLGDKTTFRAGGRADVWAEVASSADLKELMKRASGRGSRVTLLGCGSNVLVSDLGVRGIVARLSGAEFRRIERREGLVSAGGGMPVSGLLDWLEARGSEALSFMEGIPGSVGGAARMNAGALGRAFGECVEWLRCVDGNGAELLIGKSDLDFGYRRCPALDGRIVVEAGLRIEPGRGPIPGGRRAAAARRAWMKGLRSAGSVFRNPPGDYAGRLLDAAGLKGLRIGGAVVSSRHANVITTDEGAAASDVLALMGKARNEVAVQFGVELEPEIVFVS